MTGPAPRRSPRSSAERNTAKFSETRFTPRSAQARSAAAMRNSFSPAPPPVSRCMRSSDSPSSPHGTKCKNARKAPSFVAVATTQSRVGRVAEAAERHREAAFGLGAAPRRGLRRGTRATCSGVDVADPAYLAGVAGSLDPVDHLPDVAHRAALEGELGHLDDRLVAELQRGHVGLARPDLAAEFAAAQHRRHPGVPFGLVHELVDRAGPGLGVAERIAAGQHHPGHHPVGDRSLAARRPDHALVAAQGEVAERVALPVRGQQASHPCFVRQRREPRAARPGGRAGRPSSAR